MNRTRLASVLNLLWCAQAAFAVPIGAAPHFVLTDLGLSPAPSRPLADAPDEERVSINNKGQIAGVEMGRSRTQGAWIWTNGKKRFLKTAPGARLKIAGINDRGQVAGNVIVHQGEEDTSTSWFWSGQIMQKVTSPPWNQSAILGLNGHGDLTGWAIIHTRREGFLKVGGNVSTLFEDGLSGEANAINDVGQVAGGRMLDTTLHPNADVWSKGIYTSIDDKPSLDSSEVCAINSRGVVVGWRASPRTKPSTAFRFYQGKITNLGVLPGGSWSCAHAINDSELVVGESQCRATGNKGPERHAFLWERGVMRDLNDSHPKGWTLTNATGINVGGKIVGIGLFKGQRHAFLLSPAR